MAFTATTSNSAGAWRPDLYTFAPSDVIPEALILQCSTVAGRVEGDAPVVRVAYVEDDEAQITAEGAEIPEGEPELAERLVYTSKVTQLVRLSREQFEQENTANELSKSVARAIVRRADAAFIKEPDPSPDPAPAAGIRNVSGIVAGDPIAGSLDALVDLIAELESNLSMPSHIIVDPLGWGQLRKLKTNDSDSNQSLLGAGVTDAVPMLLSLPVIINPNLNAFTGVVVDRSAVVSAVGPVVVATSEHQYFSSDSILLRATWRTGHVVVRPERIGKFTITAPGS